MEDWTKKEIPKTTLNVWEENILLQELKEHEKLHNTIMGQITIGLDRFVKDIRKQVCDEIKIALRKQVVKAELIDYYYPQNIVYWQDVVAVLDKIQSKKERGE